MSSCLIKTCTLWFHQLTAPPVNTRVLAFLSAVAGDALTRHLGVILPAILSSLKGKLGTEDEAQVEHHVAFGIMDKYHSGLG